MKLATVTAAVALLAISSTPVHAQVAPAVVNVPSQQPTIQAGIDAVAAGGSVVVAPGVYNERIDYHGKATEVRSSSGAGATVIDGGRAGYVATFASNEGRGAVLQGFTLRNGANYGGVRVSAASPTITGNLIAGNEGPGVDMYLNGVTGPGPRVQGNVIRDNTGVGIYDGGFAPATELLDNVVEHNAGGITVFAGGNTTVRNNLVRYNNGTGLEIVNISDALVAGNVIGANSAEVEYIVPSGGRGPIMVNNTVVATSGVALDAWNRFGTPALYNNVFYAAVGSAMHCDGFAAPTVMNNLLYGANGSPATDFCGSVVGANGNVAANPLLMNVGDGDFRLAGLSPGVDAGSNLAPSMPVVDADGGARVIDGNGDGVAVVDIGAYETPIGPGLRPATSPIDFGSQLYPAGRTFDLTLTSSGRVPVHIGAASISGAGFSIVLNTCTGQYATLAPNAFCVVQIGFTPPGAGTYAGTFTIANDGRGGVTRAPLVAESVAAPPSKYVTAAYRYALGRDPTVAEYTFWDARLATGLSRDAFALALTGTPEHRRVAVGGYFNLFLGRFPNPAVDPIDAMVALTAPGLYPIELMAAVILASDEYGQLQSMNDFRFGDPDVPNVRFVKGLYYDLFSVLALNGDPGLAFWVNRLNGGQDRLSVAYAFLTTRTFHQQYVTGLYQSLLGRAPDAAGLQFWVDQLQRGMRTDTVRAYFLGSQEFSNRVNALP